MHEYFAVVMRVVMRVVIGVAMLAAVLVPADGFAADSRKAWLRQVAVKVAKKQTYPRAALMRSIEGKAKLRISIDRDGVIKSFDVVQATGSPVLDRELPRIVKRIDPLPKPPADTSDEGLTFVLPLAWALN